MAYTLNVFPNHHRALMALIKLAKKEKTNRPRDMGYTVECRFDRAERFAPNDADSESSARHLSVADRPEPEWGEEAGRGSGDG